MACIPSTCCSCGNLSFSISHLPFKSGNLIPFVTARFKLNLFNFHATYCELRATSPASFFFANILGNMASTNAQQRGKNISGIWQQEMQLCNASLNPSSILSRSYPLRRPTRRMRNLCAVPCVAKSREGM